MRCGPKVGAPLARLIFSRSELKAAVRLASLPGPWRTVSGIRDGVDGTYLISGVMHSLNRHSGFLTHLELKHPAGAAGTDSRAGSAKAA